MKSTSSNRVSKRPLLLAIFAIATVATAACGSNSVDSRQLQFNDGLAYVRNHDDPYTGRAIFVDTIPDVVNNFYTAAAMAAFRGNHPPIASMRCEVPFVKGLVEGDVSCKDAQGQTTLQFTIHHERIDGNAIVNDSGDGNRKFAELTWKDGTLDGHQKLYGLRGNTKNTVIDDMEVINSVKDGREIYRDEDGNVLGDGVWSHGKPITGSFVDTWQDGSVTKILTFANGVTNGKASYYSTDRGVDGKPLVSTGNYVDGNRNGPWIDYANQAAQVENTLTHMFPILGDYPSYGAILNNCDSYHSNWDHGALKGRLECYAKDGALTLSFEAKDGSVADNLSYRVPHSKEMIQLPSITPDMRPVDPNALPLGPLTGNALETCVNQWTTAFHKESGSDWAPVTSSQMDEWREWCKEGRRAPGIR